MSGLWLAVAVAAVVALVSAGLWGVGRGFVDAVSEDRRAESQSWVTVLSLGLGSAALGAAGWLASQLTAM